MNELLKLIRLYIIKNLRRIKKRINSKFVTIIEYFGVVYPKNGKELLTKDITKDIECTFGFVPTDIITEIVKKI